MSSRKVFLYLTLITSAGVIACTKSDPSKGYDAIVRKGVQNQLTLAFRSLTQELAFGKGPVASNTIFVALDRRAAEDYLGLELFRQQTGTNRDFFRINPDSEIWRDPRKGPFQVALYCPMWLSSENKTAWYGVDFTGETKLLSELPTWQPVTLPVNSGMSGPSPPSKNPVTNYP